MREANENEIPSNMLSDGLTAREKEYYKKLQIATKKLKNHHGDAVKLATSRALNITLQEYLMECPECGEMLLRHGDGDTQCECYYCGYSEKPSDVAKKYIENVLHISQYEVGRHGGEFPLFTCPDCDTDSMVKTDSSYFCFSCGVKYQLNELKYCELCGKLFFPIDDDFICKDCMDGQIDE
jgi:predicted RNA-binding Zn-ribbon protein involved in translation (DUF1610 family)